MPIWFTRGRAAALAALVALLLYILTLAPTFGFIDKGELVAVASTLGIAHPTGYPTIMFLGWLATTLLPFREVVVLNGLAAVLTAAGVAVMTLLFERMLVVAQRRRPSASEEKAPKKGAKGKRSRGSDVHPPEIVERADTTPTSSIIAPLAALVVGSSSIWWGQGNGFEVYSLHALMIPLVLLTYLRFVEREQALADGGEEAPRLTRSGMIFGLVVGLSFTNHLTTVLLAPALLAHYLVTMRRGGIGRALGRLLPLILPFALGLLPYLLLPIRASMDPAFNWGDPSTLERFWWHVTGKQYAVWFMAGGDVFAQQSGWFFGHLPTEVGIAGLLVALAGLFHLGRRNPPLLLLSLLLFVACVLWSGTYDIQEIAPYYMTAIFAVGIWILFGLDWLRQKWGWNGAIAAGLATALLTIAFNFAPSNERQNDLVEQMTRNVFSSLPDSSLIFSSQWDFWVAGSFYLQGVEHVRPDLLVIDQELLRRSWYLDQLSVNHPEFMRKVSAQTETFRRELSKFEHDRPYDPQVIDAAYYGLINAMIDSSITRRPVFITTELPPVVGRGLTRSPQGLALRLTRDSTYIAQEFPRWDFHFLDGRLDYYTTKLYQLYAAAAYDRGLYEHLHGRDSLAGAYLTYALQFDPQIDEREIPSLPLQGEESVAQVAGWFAQLRATAGATAR